MKFSMAGLEKGDFLRGGCMDMFDFMVQSSGNLNLYIKRELPYRWCNGFVVDCGFEPRSGQTKYYKIGICCFSDKHVALRRNSRLVVSESDNVTDWGDMSIRGLLR
jgi:hypothetical protein